MRLAATTTACVALLAGCVSDQGPAGPPDPNAPFPLANSRIVGQPAPGSIIVETRQPAGMSAGVRPAARNWCGGDAQVSLIESDVSRFMQRRDTWVVRCR